jgi:soluble lytic murein transglycosylase-like protein
LRAAEDRALQTQAIERNKKFEEASTQLQIYPPIREVMANGLNGKPYDPTKLTVVKAANVQRDKQGNVKFDSTGAPLVSETTREDDKRYVATYDGQELTFLDEDAGREIAKSLPDYRVGALAINPKAGQRQTSVTPQAFGPISQEGAGLAAQLNERAATVGNQAIERYGSPATEGVGATAPSPEALEGKTPEQQAAITARFEAQKERLKGVPQGVREVVERVNADPALANQPPIVKALASQESGGKRGIKSPTGVKDLMQVTGATFDDIQRRYPNVIPKSAKGTSEGSVLAGKIYLADLLTQFEDLPLALLAYNAGPGDVAAAKRAAGSSDLARVMPELKKILYAKGESGKKKWDDEVEDYVDKVMSYYKLYNGQ